MLHSGHCAKLSPIVARLDKLVESWGQYGDRRHGTENVM